ncbi:MAG: hypothetical protein U0V73_09835 [Acidimicrobiia bacterium]
MIGRRLTGRLGALGLALAVVAVALGACGGSDGSKDAASHRLVVVVPEGGGLDLVDADDGSVVRHLVAGRAGAVVVLQAASRRYAYFLRLGALQRVPLAGGPSQPVALPGTPLGVDVTPDDRSTALLLVRKVPGKVTEDGMPLSEAYGEVRDRPERPARPLPPPLACRRVLLAADAGTARCGSRLFTRGANEYTATTGTADLPDDAAYDGNRLAWIRAGAGDTSEIVEQDPLGPGPPVVTQTVPGRWIHAVVLDRHAAVVWNNPDSRGAISATVFVDGRRRSGLESFTHLARVPR